MINKELTPNEELALLLEEKENRKMYNKLAYAFPATGKFRRELYPKQLELFRATKDFNQVAMVAANRCFAADTLVNMADGTTKPIQNIEVGECVQVFDIKSNTVVDAPVVDTFKGFSDEMVSFSAGNNFVTCTSDHEFLHYKNTTSKRPISDIAELADSRIVMPYKWKPSQVRTPGFTTDVARLIGYLLGDGGLTQDCVRFTNEREEYHRDVAAIAASLGLHVRRYGSDAYLSVEGGVKGGNPLINLLRELGLWKTNSHTKFIPKELLTAPIEYVEEALKGLMATDGCITKDRATYYSCSYGLLTGMRNMLWRLEIQSYIYLRRVHKGVPQYYLEIRRTDVSKLPYVASKTDNFKDARAPSEGRYYRTRAIQLYKAEKAQDIYCITVDHPDHLFIANGLIVGNSGKSYAAAYMMAVHLTGLYPDWWEGRKWKKPVNAWSIGVSNTQTKQVNQKLLCGDYTDLGSGLIPKECIGKRVNRPGVSEGIETLKVKHYTDGVFDGWSTIGFKAYEMERKEFQGFEVDIAWMDEEPPAGKSNIYSEVHTRTATTDGLIYCTFTPLFGISDVVESFCPGGRFPENGIIYGRNGNPLKYVINVEWTDQIPHLPVEKQEELLQSYSPHERDARAKGIPQLGSGAIYPILEDDIICDTFEIPPNWKRVMGIDVSPTRTAIVWAAISPADGTVYLYSEYYAEKLEHPAMIKDAIHSRGPWVPGCIDPASDKLIAPGDGRTFLAYFAEQGINLVVPTKSLTGVEAGLYKTRTMLESGMLKVFNTMSKWREEYRLYRRDEYGKILKKKDDLMDATRYIMVIGLDIAETLQEATDDYSSQEGQRPPKHGASRITGY